jgi:hypothetical protein
MENRQEDHQDSVGELEGIISKKPIFILIDLGSNISYVSPQVVDAILYKERNMQGHD